MNEDKSVISRRNFLLRATGIIGSRLFLGGRNCDAKASQSSGHPKAISSEVNGLDPRFTFDTFTVHRDNQVAHAAASAVAESPGVGFNPLFIYGQHGTGKTHLMHAIGNRAASARRRVIYVPAEHFGSEFIEAIKNRRLMQFRRRYREADVVLVDAVQHLSGSEIQEEFLEMFNDRFDGHKQLVLAGICSPKQMPNLDQRLAARFEWGMIAHTRLLEVESWCSAKKKLPAILFASNEPAIRSGFPFASGFNN
jgi:chromosomal replication initiator protein